MNKEIERKYLLPSFPQELLDSGKLKLISRVTIEQTYLAMDDAEEVRVRKLSPDNGDEASYTHTYKRGKGFSREEVEYEISSSIYHQLLDGSGRAPLVKTRTTVEEDGRIFEMDEYHQYQFMTVEAEFASEEEAVSFQPPAWFGSEVGGEVEYRNKRLWASLQKGAKP